MKHVLLSVLIIFSLGISIPSSTALYTQDEQADYNYELLATVSEPKLVANADMQKAVVLPPVQSQLDVKRLYLRNYFKGLTENFGYNHKGSCSYIAVEMVLSYFDSYLYDDIISEQYDVVSTGNDYDMINRNNSPGTVNDKISDDIDYINELSKDEYYDELKQKFGNTSLQLKLFDIAKEKNLGKSNRLYGLTISATHALVINYLNERGYKRYEDYRTWYKSDIGGGDVKQFIIDNIDLGRPVIVGGNGTRGGHAFVCYDYDSKDKIFAHMGWHSEIYSRFDPFSPNNEPNCFNTKLDAMAIEFYFDHTHSYNYMVGDKAYCYCDEAIETYHNHSYERCLNYSNDFHRTYCNCGKYLQSPHWVKGPTGGQRYVKCAACGVQLDTWSDVIIGVVMSLSETANGSYISQSGIPVIMEEDVEAYLSATLKFGSVIENYDYI